MLCKKCDRNHSRCMKDLFDGLVEGGPARARGSRSELTCVCAASEPHGTRSVSRAALARCITRAALYCVNKIKYKLLHKQWGLTQDVIKKLKEYFD
ncbi:hypothetical protein B5X24_HaOG205967 [Helicoverpa armigera]|uniref:Uncharacterized protein n=1 Tax=Helicoverpa armigera TaxID=29058 RepID=A0A2W1BRY0_HELAM|nr:hypothetical protein B5X24_HaOG205967 [Helicoverpa armigera]